VFLLAAVIVSVGWRVVGDDALAHHGVVWVANVAMLVTIWIGLRVRGESWRHIGLRFAWPGARTTLGAVFLSIAVLVFALAAFVFGSMVTMRLQTTAGGADLGSYEYLQGNLPMLLLSLAAVYVVSSFGEEVVYFHATDAGRPVYERMGHAAISTHTVFIEKRFLSGH
jgi:hypothetical protein